MQLSSYAVKMQNLQYEGSCFLSKYLRITPLSRGNGNNYNRESRSLVRSSVMEPSRQPCNSPVASLRLRHYLELILAKDQAL
jgi:hypothetical protein